LAKSIVLILYLFWLANAINFRKDYSPPLVAISTLSPVWVREEMGRASQHKMERGGTGEPKRRGRDVA